MTRDTAAPKRPRLTPAQETMLRAVVASNGGGVLVGFSESERRVKTMRVLERLQLVQGKKGSPSWAVHTPPGLAWVRGGQP